MPLECDDLIGTPKHLVLRTPTTMTGRVIVETGSSVALAAVLDGWSQPDAVGASPRRVGGTTAYSAFTVVVAPPLGSDFFRELLPS